MIFGVLGTSETGSSRWNRLFWTRLLKKTRGFYHIPPPVGRLSTNTPKSRVRTPMRHLLVFSLSSPPHSHPGHCGYLRSMLCALRQMVTPLDGLGAGARSRRNLACIQRESRTLRFPRDRAPAPRPSRGVTIWRRAQRIHWRYPQPPGWLRGGKL